jgi:hypothetical protein
LRIATAGNGVERRTTSRGLEVILAMGQTERIKERALGTANPREFRSRERRRAA